MFDGLWAVGHPPPVGGMAITDRITVLFVSDPRISADKASQAEN